MVKRYNEKILPVLILGLTLTGCRHDSEKATTQEVTTESSVDVSNSLTCDEAINIVESGEGFSEAGFSYTAFKNSAGSYAVKVSSPSIMASGGSGTLGIYDVFTDKTYQLSETNDLSGQSCN